jgi:hypothetical protein
VECIDCKQTDPDQRALARAVVAQPVRLELERGAERSHRWSSVSSCAATAALGWMLWFGGGALDLPARPNREIVMQPAAARSPFVRHARVLTGLASEPLDKPGADTQRKTRAERAESRKLRKEAARAKREAAQELRASTAQERREASKARRQAAHEERAAAMQARREAAEERREASKAKHESAHEGYAAAMQARREAADERREAAKAKHEAAHEERIAAMQARREAAEARRDAARQAREMAHSHPEPAGAERREQPAVPESAPSGSSAYSMAGGAASGSGSAGILRINSLPWAQVFIDGRMVGYTPQRGISLTPGEHDVRLVNSAFKMRKTLHVRIAQGQQVTRSEILED